MRIQFIFPPDENEINLLFPENNTGIDISTSTTFDQIKGSLPVNRLTDIDGVLNEEDAHDIWKNT